jgi:hypothetical protein
MQQEYRLTYRSPRPFYDGTRRDIGVSASGAPAASGGYVERHLINVHSDPLVGFLLLLPILAALLLPALLRRPSPQGAIPHPNAALQQDAPASVAFDGAVQSQPAAGGPRLADASTILQPAGIGVILPDIPHCRVCDAALAQPDARFCDQCGAAQEMPQTAPGRRVFCDQCGRPLRDQARFCSTCGATVPQGLGVGGRRILDFGFWIEEPSNDER